MQELCDRITAALDPLEINFEIVLIEDRSRDSSWLKIQEAAKKNPRIRGYRLSRNFGQHYAITAGLAQTKGDWVVVMDCDLQELPEDIPRLFEIARSGHDIVLTRRMHRKGSLGAALGSRLFYKLLVFLTGDNYETSIGALSVLSRNAVRAFLSFKEYHRYYLGVIKYLGFEPRVVDVENHVRKHGPSSYTTLKRIELAINGIVSTSTRPLYISVFIGFALSALSITYLLYVLFGVVFLGHGIPGWPSAIASTLLIGGVISSLLGVIGIYLARIYVEIRQRPLYIFADSTDPEFETQFE